MISPQRKYAPTGQHVQISPPFRIEQVASLAPHVLFVETDGAQHLYKCRIDVSFVEFVLPALLAVEPGQEICRRRGTRFSVVRCFVHRDSDLDQTHKVVPGNVATDRSSITK